MPYPVLVGRGSDIIKSFKLKILPQLVIVDRKGMVVLHRTFAQSEEIREVIKGINKEKP